MNAEGLQQVNGDLHAAAGVFGGRVQDVIVAPGQLIAGKGAEVIQRVGAVDLKNLIAQAGADGGGNCVGEVGQAQNIKKVKPDGVYCGEEVVRLGFNVRTKKPRTSRLRYISIAAFS